MRVWAPALLILGLCGCWKLDPAELPESVVAFDPLIGGPEGWVVEEIGTDNVCPDGNTAPFYVVYPETSAAPLPVAVILHSGAFDYAVQPPATDPLAGPHFQPESRLERDWAVRQAFAMLGMYAETDPKEDHFGALAAALANANIAMIVPTNCWGDWWHNKSGVQGNDFATDRFERNGLFAAEWAYRMASEPGFPSANRVELPVQLDNTQVYLIGLGEGGRGVGELLALGVTQPPKAILVDSSSDSLAPFYADPTLYDPVIQGLNRIFPTGTAETTEASLASVPMLPRAAYLYSSLDTEIPAGAHDAAITRISGNAQNWIYDAGVSKHVLLGSDAALAGQAVTWLVGGTP